MLFEDAKRKILKAFATGINPVTIYQDISEDDYIAILSAVKKTIPFKKPNQNQSLILFLYAGCLKFDRWLAPTPTILNNEFINMYQLFVDALVKAEGKVSDNTNVFLLRILKNRIFSDLDSVPLQSIAADVIEYFVKKVSEIPSPINIEKRREFEEEKSKVQAIISGIKDGSLTTSIVTRIPYIVHLQQLKVNLTWNNLDAVVELTPVFNDIPLFVKCEPAGQPVGPSRWQSGITTIKISFNAIINTDAEVPSLLHYEGEDLPIQGWSKDFVYAYGLIHDVSWKIRLSHEGEKQWVPAPRDLPEAEVEICSNAMARIFWKKKGSPGALYKVFHPIADPLNLDLGCIEQPLWHLRCKWIAVTYLAMGETNEALFWLNVGVEALFKERFELVGRIFGRSNIEEELAGTSVYWDEANEIVTKQYPELIGKIDWPETGAHVSIYRKLKYVYKHFPMRETIKELLANYSLISKHRNALFHGAIEERLSAGDAKVAIKAFDWIDQYHEPTLVKE